MTPPADVATAEAMAVPDRPRVTDPHVAASRPQDEEPIEDGGPLMAHDYDGIREYDNPLPGWWRAIFWGSIVFAAGYWIWFHVGHWGRTPDQKYQAALAEYEGKRDIREAAEAAAIDENTLARDSNDPNLVSHGASIFAARCASCHDATGHGLIGPNLTDLYQLHGSSRLDIFKTVRTGVAGTAMPAWGEQLPPSDVIAVASFAITLRGKNLPGKAPQGMKVEPFR